MTSARHWRTENGGRERGHLPPTPDPEIEGVLVLALTPKATSVIKDLTALPQIPEGSGLRIAPAPDGSGELQLSLQAQPVPGDEIIDNQGVRVFLEPATANLLADQTLDAQVTDGGAGFYLTGQDPEPGRGRGPQQP